MASTQHESGNGRVVLVPTACTGSRPISSSDRLVSVSRPVALKPEESAFVEKTLHYISSIRGAVSTDLTLSTNTKYPTRYIIMIRGLPLIHMGDFESIYNTNGLIREMKVNMLESSLRIDVWRGNASVRKKKKKRRWVESSACRLVCDMSNVDNRDTKCLTQLLKLLSGMENVECQFTVQVNTSNPEYYSIDCHILDSICIQEINNILHKCRNFCSDISFDFPHKIVRAKCLRLAAPLRRRTLTLKK